MRTVAFLAALAVLGATALTWAAPKYTGIVLSEEKGGTAKASFKTTTPKVYLRAKVEEPSAGTKVKAEWIAVKTQVAPPDYKIDGTELTVGPGRDNVTFTLSKPTAGWPEGEYRVNLFIDGKPAGQVPFKVTK